MKGSTALNKWRNGPILNTLLVLRLAGQAVARRAVGLAVSALVVTARSELARLDPTLLPELLALLGRLLGGRPSRTTRKQQSHCGDRYPHQSLM